MIDRIGVRVSAVAAVLDVILVGLLRAWRTGGEGLAPEAVIPLLGAAAALCVVGLAIDRRPTVAWLATVTALSIATVDLASLARIERPSLTTEAWIWWAVAITISGAFATGTAVMFASGTGRRLASWEATVGTILVAGIVLTGAWAIATPGESGVDGGAVSLGNLGLVTRLFLVGTLSNIALGIVGGARPAWRDARLFLAQTRPRPTSPLAWLALAPTAMVRSAGRSRRGVSGSTGPSAPGEHGSRAICTQR